VDNPYRYIPILHGSNILCLNKSNHAIYAPQLCKYSIVLVTLNNPSDVSAHIGHNKDKIMYLVLMPLQQSLPKKVVVY
jgi:hypothetical protein